jgi:hypothetical protein
VKVYKKTSSFLWIFALADIHIYVKIQPGIYFRALKYQRSDFIIPEKYIGQKV